MSKEHREKAIEVISRDPNRLVKTNPIINAKFDITAVQMKVFLKVIASVDQSNDDLPDVQISLKEFQNFVGGKTKNLLKYLQEELTKLRKKDIYYEDDKIKLEANFFSSIVYDKVQAKFIFEFSNKLKPFLLQIKENFTVLDIRNLLFLDSIYAIRFYEFCKQYERFGSFELDVEDLKDRLGLSTRYKNYFDFKLKVLQQARTELESSSDLYFDFEEIKSGKKVIRLRFIIIENRQKTKVDESLQLQIVEIHTLVKEYVTEAVVNTWFKKYPCAQILAGVEYTLKEIKQGKVQDPARYLQKMVSAEDIVKQQETKELKIRAHQEQLIITENIKVQEKSITYQKDSLLKAYYDDCLEYAIHLLRFDPTVGVAIYNELKNKIENGPKTVTDELVWEYILASNESSIPMKFYGAIQNQQFMVTSFVVTWCKNHFIADFQKIKDPYLPKAKKFGLVL